MDTCKTILAAIRCALESEERRLKPRSRLERRPWTVSGVYPEAWICYLLIKELADRCPDEWEFDREVSRVDLLICGHATVELKGPDELKEPFPKCRREEFLEDFKKQHIRAGENPNLQHFVLLILHAPKSVFYDGIFQRWLDQLELDVRKNNPDICIRLQPSKPLVLNGDQGLMEFCLYSVH